MVAFLQAWLATIVNRSLHIRSEQPLTLSDSEPEPDLAVVTGDLNDYRSHHPLSARLVIESCSDRRPANAWNQRRNNCHDAIVCFGGTEEANTFNGDRRVCFMVPGI